MSGYVYLIGSSTFGWYKIGKSITPEIRINNLGILLPFKIEIFGIWSAKNHHLLEKSLHEIYKSKKINGEWFEFTRDEAIEMYSSLPQEVRIYPLANSDSSFNRFSNIISDTRKDRRVIGLRTEKLRGEFTDDERNAKRIAGIEKVRRKKELRKNAEITGLIKIPNTMEPLYGLITYALTVLDRQEDIISNNVVSTK